MAVIVLDGTLALDLAVAIQAFGQRPQDPGALAAIAEAARNGARLVSLCGGAFVLGQAGVLDGHQVTTHWALADEFRAAFPRVRLVEQPAAPVRRAVAVHQEPGHAA